MFKPNYSVCVECNREGLIVVKKGYCAKCNYTLKQAKKGLKAKSSSITYTKKPTGEKEVFKEIWEELDNNCYVCSKQLTNYSHIYMSHILSKGAYPAFRLNKKNIIIKCFSCHQKWDFGIKSDLKKDSKWDGVFDLFFKLKRAYYDKDKKR